MSACPLQSGREPAMVKFCCVYSVFSHDSFQKSDLQKVTQRYSILTTGKLKG